MYLIITHPFVRHPILVIIISIKARNIVFSRKYRTSFTTATRKRKLGINRCFGVAAFSRRVVSRRRQNTWGNIDHSMEKLLHMIAQLFSGFYYVVSSSRDLQRTLSMKP